MYAWFMGPEIAHTKRHLDRFIRFRRAYDGRPRSLGFDDKKCRYGWV